MCLRSQPLERRKRRVPHGLGEIPPTPNLSCPNSCRVATLSINLDPIPTELPENLKSPTPSAGTARCSVPRSSRSKAPTQVETQQRSPTTCVPRRRWKVMSCGLAAWTHTKRQGSH